MSGRHCATNRAHTVVTGVILVLSGVVLLGALRGWWEIERYWAFWPLVFLLPAVQSPRGPRAKRWWRGWPGLALAAAWCHSISATSTCGCAISCPCCSWDSARASCIARGRTREGRDEGRSAASPAVRPWPGCCS